MSTFIECNNCGEVKDVEAKSVTLPYFCDECVAADQFQPDIQPKSVEVAIKRLNENTTLTELVTKEELRASYMHNDYPTLTELVTKEELRASYMHDDNATVENTTLLIEDLEAQIVEQKELNGKANELLNDMSLQLTEDAAELGERDRQIATDTEIISDLSSQLHTAQSLNERLQQDMSTLIDKLNVLRNNAEQRGIQKFQENVALAQYVGNMLELAASADAEISDLRGQLEVAGNKLVIEKMVVENSNRIAQMTQGALAQANQELKDVTADRDYLRKRRDHWRSEAVARHSENKRIYNRGLLARIRNEYA